MAIQKLFYEACLIGGRNVGVLIIGFLQMVVLASFLNKDNYGELIYILSLIAVAAPLSQPGQNSSFLRAVAQGRETSFRIVFSERLRWSFLGTALGFIYALYLYIQGSGLALVIIEAAVLFPLYFSTDLYLSLLNGRKDYKGLATVQLVYRLLIFLTVSITAILSGNLIACLTVIMVITILFNSLMMLKFSAGIDATHGDEINSDIAYGKHLTLIGVIPAIEVKIDNIIIGTFYSMNNLASYGFAKTVLDQYKNIHLVIYQLIFPRLASQPHELSVRSLHKYFIVYLLICLSGAGVLYLATYVLLNTNMLLAYKDSSRYVLLLLLSYLLSIPGAWYEMGLNAHKMIKEQYIVRTIMPATYFLALPIMIYLFKLDGIIYSMFLRNTIYSMTVVFITLKSSYVRIKHQTLVW